MFCGHCGEKLKEDSQFCGKCGKRINVQNIEDKKDQKIKEQQIIVEEVEIVEVEEKEKKVESLTTNGMIYTVVALTMILSFAFIIVCSLI